jgi:hypothetical protein
MALGVRKAQEQVKLALSKNNLADIKIDVEFITDVSGSMSSMYGTGKPMESVLQKALAVATVIDPNQELLVTAFSNSAIPLGTYGVTQYDSISNDISSERPGYWSGTNYSSAIELLVNEHQLFNQPIVTRELVEEEVEEPSNFVSRLFGSKPKISVKKVYKDVVKTDHIIDGAKPEPKLVLFFTDGGDGGSKTTLYKQLKYLVERTSIFVMFIGIGQAKSTLRQIDEDFDGIGSIILEHPDDLSDDEFADLLITREFSDWYKRKVTTI